MKAALPGVALVKCQGRLTSQVPLALKWKPSWRRRWSRSRSRSPTRSSGWSRKQNKKIKNRKMLKQSLRYLVMIISALAIDCMTNGCCCYRWQTRYRMQMSTCCARVTCAQLVLVLWELFHHFLLAAFHFEIYSKPKNKNQTNPTCFRANEPPGKGIQRYLSTALAYRLRSIIQFYSNDVCV